MMSPRPGLIPGTMPRSATDIEASVGGEVGEHLGRDDEALHAEIERAVAAWAAAARLRTAPPMPTIRVPAEPEPVQTRHRLSDVVAQAGEILPLDRPVTGQQLLGDAHGPEREGHGLLRAATGTWVSCMDAAADVEHHPVGERGRVDGGDVAVVRLLLRRQGLDGQARRSLGVGQEPLPVGGIADGAGGDDMDVIARWLARQKRANTPSVSRPRPIASSLSLPEAARPAPMRTVS